MKVHFFLIYVGVFLIVRSANLFAQDLNVATIEEYNEALPIWGVTWSPGANAVNGYYPSFYTGFAVRSQSPERVHIRVSRGNQTRVSVILDEQTVSDYLFDLAKRYNFYKKVSAKGIVNVNPQGGKMLPQLAFFNQIIGSPVYGILPAVEQAKAGKLSPEALYAKGLAVLTALNPGRVFPLKIDLKAEFIKWKNQLNASPVGSEQGALTAINSLVWGRVNATAKPSAEILQKLNTAVQLGLQGPEDKFILAALDLFKAVTGTKYQIKVLSAAGQMEDAIQCSAYSCTLSYPEFTAIYPTGSVMASTTDQFGNRINTFSTPGLWPFLSRGNRHDVDNIREEPYYGWAPKMDYEGEGNGFHNPAVRFGGVSGAVKKSLGAPASHSTLWAVKRGGVSHGCLRLPLGHVWELRHILPVQNNKMTQVHYFGNHPQDFDLYDIDGDGSLEVMGVEYMISYNLQGMSDLAKREGADLEISMDRKIDFYKNLYGAMNVFSIDKDGRFVFSNPGVSIQSYLDLKKKKVTTRLTMSGLYPLYEQNYERDKVQFYSTANMSTLTEVGKAPIAKRIVRLMGRVKGCAPASDKAQCGEADFDQEVRELLRDL
ncbi:MAG: hypothetical protein AB7G93_13230 [Bdellovibrionales bacterium]